MSDPAPTTADPGNAVVRRGLRVLWSGAREQKGTFAFGVLGSSLFAAMTVGSAYVLGRVTEQVIVPAFSDERTTAGSLAVAAAVIFGVAFLKALGIAGRRMGAGLTQFRLQASYRRRVTRQYLRLPLSWHRRHPTGELLSNANADVEAMWFPMAPTPYAVGACVMLVITAVVLLMTDWVLALVGFCVFPIIGVVNSGYAQFMSKRLTEAQQLRGEVSALAHESFDGALVVKTLGREAHETARFRREAERLRDANVRVGRLFGFFEPLTQALPSLGVLIVLLVGTVRIQAGAVDTGQVVRVAYLFTVLAFPIQAIGWLLGDLPRAVVGADRVHRVLSATGALGHGAEELPPGDGPVAVEVDRLRFRYADAEPDAHVLDGVRFELPPGRTVAVVGSTGSGKSTLVGLLLRLIDPDAGAVRFDSVDLRSLAPGGISRVAAVVPQQTFLFDDTIRGNVTLGLDVGDDEIWAALSLAQADRFVRVLPQGLDTMVGERGTTLSGGQRQRIALARALVRRPRLLVLDDATSSVDPQVEAAILAGLRDATRVGRPSTVLVVAYRPATIALADEVIFIDRGRVQARATHDTLLRSHPAYARLVTAYAEAEAEREDSRHARAGAAADRTDPGAVA